MQVWKWIPASGNFNVDMINNHIYIYYIYISYFISYIYIYIYYISYFISYIYMYNNNDYLLLLLLFLLLFFFCYYFYSYYSYYSLFFFFFFFFSLLLWLWWWWLLLLYTYYIILLECQSHLCPGTLSSLMWNLEHLEPCAVFWRCVTTSDPPKSTDLSHFLGYQELGWLKILDQVPSFWWFPIPRPIIASGCLPGFCQVGEWWTQPKWRCGYPAKWVAVRLNFSDAACPCRPELERNSDQWHAFRLLFSVIFGGYNNYYELLSTVINYYVTSYQAADLKPKPDSCSTTLLWHLRFAVNLSSVGQRVAMLKLASGVGTAWNSRKERSGNKKYVLGEILFLIG